jgi:hypothetical protein
MNARSRIILQSGCRCGIRCPGSCGRLILILLTAFCTGFAQVQSVPPPLPASGQSACCVIASSCCSHAPADTRKSAGMNCMVCVTAAASWAVLAACEVTTEIPVQSARFVPRDEVGAARRDPPPLPPPR